MSHLRANTLYTVLLIATGSLRALVSYHSKNPYHFLPFDLLFSSTLKMEAAGSSKMLVVTK
jgi:hypothetical protein